MPPVHWDLATAADVLGSPRPELHAGLPVDVSVVVVEVDEPTGSRENEVALALTQLPVVAIGAGSASASAWDLIAEDPDSFVALVEAQPEAAVLAAEVLQANEKASARLAWRRESLAYATLQASTAHQSWLAARGRRVRRDTGSRVAVSRTNDPPSTVVTLTRPRLHNLLDRQMRDELIDAFWAAADGDDPIYLRAEGPSFCAGGDPAEFGSADDPAHAHAIRDAANVAAAVWTLRHRLTAEIDGPAIGAGIELAALAQRVRAGPHASFALPELGMGLIPGAGGTFSIPRRIGRQRTLSWLLTGDRIDAETALAWGLVDELSQGSQ